MLKRTMLVAGVAVALQGCVPQMIMDSQDRQHYSEYVTKTQQINFEREKAGLAPERTMTFDEWEGKK